MFMNSTKMLFYMMIISSTFITISSNSWLSSWMGLEINLLSFIPLMINKNNLISTETSLKYFLTQALASLILLFLINFSLLTSNFINMFYSNLNFSFLILMNSSLLLKMGTAPFHFWFPEVMEGLSWINNLILMTWQKIAPFMLISYCFNFKFLFIIMILSILIGSLSGLNQTSLRKLMAFSSINHLGWMISAMLLSENLWFLYFYFYTFISLTIISFFNLFQIFYLIQIYSLNNKFSLLMFIMFLSLLSLGGLPPFLGFFPKWMIIQSMIFINQYMMIFFMISLTLITLFFYMRICFSIFLFNYKKNNWSMNLMMNNFYFFISLILAFFSIFGLILVNLFYFFF